MTLRRTQASGVVRMLNGPPAQGLVATSFPASDDRLANRATARNAATPPLGDTWLNRAGTAVIVALGVLAFAEIAGVAGFPGVGPGTASRGGEAVASWPEFMAIVAIVFLFVIIVVRVTLAAEARERD